MYKRRNSKGNIVNQHGQCTHSEQEHRNGSCWHIINQELKHMDDTKKYCRCVQNPGNIKSFELIGYMQQEQNDLMVTKHCSTCNKLYLIRIDEPNCMECKHKKQFT